MKSKEDKINGLNKRHVAQIVRRKTIQKSHGDKNKYKRDNHPLSPEILDEYLENTPKEEIQKHIDEINGNCENGIIFEEYLKLNNIKL